MPSAKDNSTLFDVTSAWDVPFGIPQYVQYIFHELTSVLLIYLCWQYKVLIWWLHVMASFACVMEIVCIFHSGYLDIETRSWFVLVCNELKIVEREAQWMLHFSDDNWWAPHLYLGRVASFVFFIVAALALLFVQFVLLCNCSSIADKDA